VVPILNTLEELKMSKFTPGPWRVGDAGLTVFGPKSDKPSPEIIAPCKSRDNAQLIAAAPELLTMLQRFYDATYGKTDLIPLLDFEQARAAIVKAGA
jgi:hypothetical protein